MKAILVNRGGVVLGEKQVSGDCDRIEYGGGTFLLRPCLITRSIPVVLFVESPTVDVVGKLDKSYL